MCVGARACACTHAYETERERIFYFVTFCLTEFCLFKFCFFLFLERKSVKLGVQEGGKGL